MMMVMMPNFPHLTRDSMNLEEEILAPAISNDDFDAHPVIDVWFRVGGEGSTSTDKLEVGAVQL